ncbi:LysR family transcriptional regulator [Actinomycetospora sp. NBRC 106378]|uniref:LysR family transcriptional regulator n=1 Tax=Actinomycetospora sp. NBRC 106378 TaxID=3032208 RepID=UPI0024A369D9|nr:LysR family transcriptional regulator [Actinomycetospora sp. NBRC 106378]GLZ52137.1 putative transcriptional regulator, LysR family protein [Actinomycetospora sp. NBRC 106378]
MALVSQLRRLEMFCAVVDEGGVTRAAEHFHVAQPWVSAQLRTLEKSVGAPLFVREGRRNVLTEAGRRFYAWATEVLASAAQAQRDIDDLTSGAAGTLAVATSMAIGTYLIPPLMTDLRRERAGAEITISISEPAVAMRRVETGEVDFAVTTWLDEVPPSGVRSEKLWDEPIVLCAAPDGPPADDVVDLADVVGLPLVGVPAGVAIERVLDRQLRAAGLTTPSYVIRLGHAEALKRAVADNGWVCFAPLYCVADDVAAGRLRAVPVRGAELVETIGLFSRDTTWFSPLQRAAMDTLRSTAARKRRPGRGPDGP